MYFYFVLLQKYKEDLMARGKKNVSDEMESVILLLKHTSNLVQLFNDRLFIYSNDDDRIKKLKAFYNFLMSWRDETKESNNLFISSKLFFDLQSMCLGFQAMIDFKTSKFKGSVVKPCIMNQDCVENHFCQVRACNGQNNNPTYLQQAATQSSIRYGQTTVSRKSNAAKLRVNKNKACSLPR
jgi:hypothetical protein